jgi:hypothetical protein
MISGQIAVAQGGTNSSTAQGAINTLAGAVTSGSYLRGNGTNVTMSAIQAADVPTLNQNTTGTAANITASSNSSLTTLSALSLPGSQVSGNISGNAANVTGIVAVANGGTGTTTPALVAGTNVTITGTWPNQTINSTGGGGGMIYPGAGIANSTGSAWGTSYGTSGASSVVLRNSDVNVSSNNFNAGWTSTSLSTTLVLLTNASSYYQEFTGSISGQVVRLPYGPTAVLGQSYIIINNGSFQLDLRDAANVQIKTLYAGEAVCAVCKGTSTSNNWEVFVLVPTVGPSGSISWDNLSLQMAGSGLGGVSTFDLSGQLTSTVATGTAPFVVSSTTPVANLNIGGNAATATTVSGTVAIGNGGTGQTTAAAAFNALSPILVTGDLIVGTGLYTAGRLGIGVSGRFLTVSGGTPAWADIPTLNQNTTGTAANITATSNSTLTTLSSLSLPGSQVSGNISGNAANVTGTVAIANGGSGTTTAQGGMNAFAGAVTAGSYLRGNGANVVMSTIQATDVPTLNQNTSGTAAGLSATLAIASGGTNTTATPTAGGITYGTGTAQAYSAVGTAGQVLTSNGASAPTWSTIAGLGTVTSVAATVPAFLSISGSPITTSGTLAISYSGTALPVANGGTGTTTGSLVNCTVDGTNAVGYLNVPQNAQTGAYTLVLADGGKHIYHASGSAAATYTIPAASSVAFPIGTVISFVNLATAAVTISITTDTMYLASTGTTGSRTLAQYGIATATKVSGLSATGIWVISGSGLT